jgi:hypothetical protein
MTARIKVGDHHVWGKLVKTWATGRNYIDHNATEAAPIPTNLETPPRWPKPTSFKDFADQCIRANVGLFFDDGNKTPVTGNEDLGFVLLQATSNTSVLRLPAADKIAESEAELATIGYPLPDFYERIFGGKIKSTEVEAPLQKARLHAERVGEYTINTCH